jgi:hypothetical protein
MNGLGYDASSEEVRDIGKLEVALQLRNAALPRIDVADNMLVCETISDVRLIPSVAAKHVLVRAEQPASLHIPAPTSESPRPNRRSHWTIVAFGL